MHMTNDAPTPLAAEGGAEETLRKARVGLERVMQMMATGNMATSIGHEINLPWGAIVSNGDAAVRCRE